jgi:hypothetical protein
MKQAFLSYAREDSRKAKRLYADLRRKASIRVWIDSEELLPGARWEPAVRKAIRESDYFLAVLSNKAVAARGFRHTELREALEVAKEFPEDWIYLIPTRLDECRMPFSEMEAYNYADLFPRWGDGLNRVCRTLKYHGGGRKESPQGDTLDLHTLGEGRDTGTKIKRRKPGQRRRSQADRSSQHSFHYKVGLVDLEERIPTIGRIVRGLNKVQSSFKFTRKRLGVPRQALTWFDDSLQLYIPSLPRSFYNRIGPLDTDCVVGLTLRLLAGEDKKSGSYYNYLADESPVDPRVLFISYSGLAEYAHEADVALDSAIAYLITAQLVAYFFDLGYDLNFGYHPETRNCPMDFTEYHSELVGGLRAGRFCRVCSRKLEKSGPFAKAFRAMIAWGR